MKKTINIFKKHEQGAIIIMTTFLAFVYIALAALFVDGFRLYETKQEIDSFSQYATESINKKLQEDLEKHKAHLNCENKCEEDKIQNCPENECFDQPQECKNDNFNNCFNSCSSEITTAIQEGNFNSILDKYHNGNLSNDCIRNMEKFNECESYEDCSDNYKMCYDGCINKYMKCKNDCVSDPCESLGEINQYLRTEKEHGCANAHTMFSKMVYNGSSNAEAQNKRLNHVINKKAVHQGGACTAKYCSGSQIGVECTLKYTVSKKDFIFAGIFDVMKDNKGKTNPLPNTFYINVCKRSCYDPDLEKNYIFPYYFEQCNQPSVAPTPLGEP